MAGRRLEYEIGVDPSKGIAGLKQFSTAAKKAMGDVDSSLDDTRRRRWRTHCPAWRTTSKPR